MSTAYTSSIAARVLTDAGGPAPGRIQLFPVGEFSARDGRPGTLKGVNVKAWIITPTIAAAVVARWQARETPLVVDAFIQADEYRYISPVFTFDPETGAVLELKSAALTNYPALDGMAAVAARAEDDLPMKKELADKLCRLLGLAADATEDAMLTELQKLPDGKALAVALSEKDTEIAALKAADPDPTKYVPAAMLTAAQEKNAELTARVKELEDNGVLAGLTAEIDAAVADGRLPKSCEAWAKATAKTHPDAVKSYIASSTTPIAALKGTQTGGTPPDGTPRTAALTDEDRYAAKVAGISEEDFVAAKAKEKN